MPRIYIETYGCSNNIAEGQIMKALLSSGGATIVDNEDIAEIVILNTCIVKEKTISKIKRRIQEFYKNFGNKLIIAGCMPEVALKQIEKLAKNSSIISTHHIKNMPLVINNLLIGKKVTLVGEQNQIKCLLPKMAENKLISITPISSGCNGRCSYCLTRFAKGKLFSYPIDKIVKSIENDLVNGAKEVWITSQDNAAYGMDIDGISRLPQLLEKILALKGKFKLRLGMMDPNNVLPITDKILELYENKKMYKFLHIPIQSASNKILSDMNRFYKIEEAEKIIKKWREKFPFGVFATDIIVGYPTETDEDHKLNLEFIRKYKPEVLNLSKFSSHKNTLAGKLKTLPNSLVHKRARQLMEEHRKTAKERKEEYINSAGKEKEIKVLVNKKIENSDRLCEARDENYNVILVKCGKEYLGKEISVRINEIGVHHMIGEQIRLKQPEGLEVNNFSLNEPSTK